MKNKTEFTAVIFAVTFGLALAVLGGGCNRREKNTESRRSAAYSPTQVHAEPAQSANEERAAKVRDIAERYRKEATERKGGQPAESAKEESVGIVEEPHIAEQLSGRAVAAVHEEAVEALEKERVVPGPDTKRPEHLDAGSSPVMKSTNRLLRILDATVEGVEKSMGDVLPVIEREAEASETNVDTERTYQ